MGQIRIYDITIDVVKKNVKNIRLTVLPPDGRVRVSAPVRVSNETIKLFVASKIHWIKEHQDKFKNMPKELKHEYVSGEMLSVFGKRYELVVIYAKGACKIDIAGDKIYFCASGQSTPEQRESMINEWYRKILKKQIPPLLDKWQDIMGVKAEEFGVKNMRTRWGTCNIRAKRIWINLQLAKKPPECLEYVVVHELTHLLERNHNKIFKGYMDKFLPGWREIKARLNEQ